MGRVLKRQTTYWDIQIESAADLAPEYWRLSFKGKREFNFVSDTFGSLKIVDSHWLLQEYSEKWENLYISSPTSDVASVLTMLETLVSEDTNGWRSLSRYLNDTADPKAILTAGYGLLLSGPQTLLKMAAAKIVQYGVASTVLPNGGESSALNVLLLDRNFVIAESFKMEETTLDKVMWHR